MPPARHSTDSSSITPTVLVSSTSSSPPSLITSSSVTFPTVIPSPVPITTPSVVIQPTPSPVITQSPSSATSTALQEATGSSHIGLILGVVGIVLGVLLILFFGVTYLLRRRWTQNQMPKPSALVPRSGGTYAATPSHDPEEGAGFMTSGRRGSHDDDERTLYDTGHSGRRPSQASRRSSNDYGKGHQKAKISLGTPFAPGIEMDDAYAMFGGAPTDTSRTESRPTYQERHLSESSMTGGLPLNTRRRSSSQLDDSRYPGAPHIDITGRRASRQSSSLGGYQDLFSDAQPVTPPPVPRKSSVGGNALNFQPGLIPRSSSPEAFER